MSTESLMYRTVEDYEVVTSPEEDNLLILLSLPKEVYSYILGFYKLSILFLHPTYVRVEYRAEDAVYKTENSLVLADLNLNRRFPTEVQKIKDFLLSLDLKEYKGTESFNKMI